jgi:hypothetical protein
MQLYCVLSPDYPWRPTKFRIGGTFNLDAKMINDVQKLLDKFQTSESRKGFIPFKKAIEKIVNKLFGSLQEIFDQTTDPDRESTQAANVVKEDTKVDSTYIAYPRTCGFSWNCYNQLAYFSN